MLANIIVSVITGVVSALLTQQIAHWLQKQKTLHDKLLDYYGDFFDTVMADWLRARATAALWVTGDPLKDASGRGREELAKLEGERPALRLKLLQLGTRIQLIEKDQSIRQAIGALSTSQPFLLVGSWHEGTFNQRFDRYEENVGRYKQSMDDAIKLVFNRYGQAESVEQVLKAIGAAIPVALERQSLQPTIATNTDGGKAAPTHPAIN